MRLIIFMVLGFLTLLCQAQHQNSDASNLSKSKILPYGQVYFGTMMGKNASNIPKTDFGFGGNLGVLLFEKLETGLGAEVLIYDNFTNLVPHIHLGFLPLKKNNYSAFIETNLGYNFIVETIYRNQFYENFTTKGSLYLSGGLGLRLHNTDSFYIALSGGYCAAQNSATFVYSWSNYEETLKETNSRLYLRFTVGF